MKSTRFRMELKLMYPVLPSLYNMMLPELFDTVGPPTTDTSSAMELPPRKGSDRVLWPKEGPLH